MEEFCGICYQISSNVMKYYESNNYTLLMSKEFQFIKKYISCKKNINDFSIDLCQENISP